MEQLESIHKWSDYSVGTSRRDLDSDSEENHVGWEGEAEGNELSLGLSTRRARFQGHPHLAPA